MKANLYILLKYVVDPALLWLYILGHNESTTHNIPYFQYKTLIAQHKTRHVVLTTFTITGLHLFWIELHKANQKHESSIHTVTSYNQQSIQNVCPSKLQRLYIW